MSLMYRGVPHTSISSKIETVETKMIGNYRGHNYPLRRSVNLTLHPKANLIYRGVFYTMNTNPFCVNHINPSFN